jgi:hypothetical protein
VNLDGRRTPVEAPPPARRRPDDAAPATAPAPVLLVWLPVAAAVVALGGQLVRCLPTAPAGRDEMLVPATVTTLACPLFVAVPSTAASGGRWHRRRPLAAAATALRLLAAGHQSTSVRPVRCRKTSSSVLRRTSTLAGSRPRSATSSTAASPSST